MIGCYKALLLPAFILHVWMALDVGGRMGKGAPPPGTLHRRGRALRETPPHPGELESRAVGDRRAAGTGASPYAFHGQRQSDSVCMTNILAVAHNFIE